MKRVYEKPMFFAEAYQVTSSIAACAYHATTPLPVTIGDHLCTNGDNGHVYGGQNGRKGNLASTGVKNVTLFNDGDGTDCDADWTGIGSDVYYNGVSYGGFQEAFGGDGADNEQHTPGVPSVGKFFS